jgi:signal transduction histidine kinase
VKAAGLDNQEQVRGRFFWDVFIAPEEREDVIARFHALAPDYAASEYENTFTNEHGERRVVYWRAAPVQDDDGRVVSIIAEEDARRKLERNLHDGAQQRLVSISIALRLAESKLGEHPDEAAELVRGTREELSLALDELRELARGIHPAVLTDRGLRAALEALAGRAPIPVELDTVDEKAAPAVEAAAYYVVAEALTNVAKYARASSATVRVARRDGALTVSVTDDGVGGADPERGSGLRGLADRLAALDGSLAVESPNGAGTRVRAEIPLGSQPSGS